MGYAKKKRGNSVNLDSFLDLMTCELGILILMILLTGIDASQIKVLIPTPMEQESDKRALFIECRDNQLYFISLEDITKMANDRLKELAEQSKGDNKLFLEKLAVTKLQTDSYNVDLSFALIGQYALQPRADVPGYVLKDLYGEKESDWYGKILSQMNPDEEIITFLVRDDSFEVFKKARALAWLRNIQASCELMDVADPIKFGLGGQRSLLQ